MAQEKKVCARCKKTYPLEKFYKTRTLENYKDGYLPVCKSCLENTYKATDPATFMHILRAIDIPWVPSEYRAIYNKNVKPSAPNSLSILGKYIMKMKLIQYNKFGFFDSAEAQEKYEQPEYYDSIENYDYDIPLDQPYSGASSKSNFTLEPVKQEDMPEGARLTINPEEIEGTKSLEESLTQEEINYLVLKWGMAYNRSQLLTLEKMYLEMCEDYDIRTTSQKDYLKKYCVASMRYDECLASQDYESARKASGMFTNINKEAGFQPIQNQGTNEEYMNAVSYLVKLAESGGPISKDLWKEYIDYPEDIVDLSIKDIKHWQKELVTNDDTIMERYSIAQQELEEQDALVKNGKLSDETEEDEDNLNGIDMSYYDDLEENYENGGAF